MTIENLTKEKKCSSCEESFGCTNTKENGKCWCDAFPPIFEPNSAVDCLCSSCLKVATIQKINKYTASLSPEQALTNKAKDLPKTKELIEGIDYTIENGLYVFSAWFHLKRGSCCGNNCRNCPYKK
jgi:hypothetical protein